MNRKRKSAHRRTISVLLTICMLIACLPLNALSAGEPPAAGSAALPPAETSNIEESSEVCIVEEDLSKRGEYEKHFLCSDGTYIAVTYAEPVHYLDADGTWADTDVALSLNTASSRYEAQSGGFAVSFASAYSASAQQPAAVSMTDGAFPVSWTTAVAGTLLPAAGRSGLQASASCDALVPYTPSVSVLTAQQSQAASLQSFAGSPYRITLIDQSGAVLYDSDAQGPLESHQDREEFQEALSSGHGQALRWSDTLESQTYYAAETLKDGRVLRTAVTTDSILALTERMGVYFVLILAVLCALCLWFASKISAAILLPLYNIDLNHPLSQECYDEIRPFLTEIDKKQRQIDRQLAAMKNRSEEFLTITKSMAEGLVLLNRDGIILTINKTAKKIFNITDDCIGKSFMTIERGEQAREFFNPLSKVTKRSCEIEKDGRDYHLRFNQIRVDGAVRGYALIVIDVTETKRAEAQAKQAEKQAAAEKKKAAIEAEKAKKYAALSAEQKDALARKAALGEQAAQVRERRVLEEFNAIRERNGKPILD